MPRKDQGWITFQSSDEERQILEQVCQQTQRTKTDLLREMIRHVGRFYSLEAKPSLASESLDVNAIEFSEDIEPEEVVIPVISSTPGNHSTALQSIQISARNILKAQVKRIVKGRVNAEVILAIAPGVELVAIVTRTSADKLGLAKGKEVFAVIKSSSVMIAAGLEMNPAEPTNS